MKKIFYIIFEKRGRLKLKVAIILTVLFLVLWAITGERYSIFWKLALIPIGYLVLFGLISIVYVWVINPIKWLVKKIKGKK